MIQSKHHIVIVASEFPPQPGGIGNHAYNLALHLNKAGFSVNVITDQRSDYGEEELIFDQSLPFLVSRIKRYNWRFKMYLSRIIQTFKNFKKGSTIIATGKFSLWNVAFASAFFKNQTIAVIHGSEVNFKSFILKKSVDIALKRMDRIVAVSNYTKSLIAHLGQEVSVIPNGIDESDWEIKTSETNTMKGSPILTTVGRVSTRKGQLNVIKHLPALIEQFPEIHYHCVGIPTEANEFAKIALDLGVSEHITFHGSISNNRLKQMLNETDIFIMLSAESKTGDVEGFGIAILEANALGVPAIGSQGCGIEDAIDNYKSGILISNDDISQFKDAINNIIENKEAYETGAKSWVKQHSWIKIVNKYIRVMDI